MEPQDAASVAEAFFAGYRRALLARDAEAIAARYAVPALILFPGQSVAVGSSDQTRAFFAGAFGQYQGVGDTTVEVQVLAATVHSIWADVTWRHDRGDTERMVYQLVREGSDWRIAVLTPVLG